MGLVKTVSGAMPVARPVLRDLREVTLRRRDSCCASTDSLPCAPCGQLRRPAEAHADWACSTDVEQHGDRSLPSRGSQNADDGPIGRTSSVVTEPVRPGARGEDGSGAAGDAARGRSVARRPRLARGASVPAWERAGSPSSWTAWPRPRSAERRSALPGVPPTTGHRLHAAAAPEPTAVRLAPGNCACSRHCAQFSRCHPRIHVGRLHPQRQDEHEHQVGGRCDTDRTDTRERYRRQAAYETTFNRHHAPYVRRWAGLRFS